MPLKFMSLLSKFFSFESKLFEISPVICLKEDTNAFNGPKYIRGPRSCQEKILASSKCTPANFEAIQATRGSSPRAWGTFKPVQAGLIFNSPEFEGFKILTAFFIAFNPAFNYGEFAIIKWFFNDD